MFDSLEREKRSELFPRYVTWKNLNRLFYKIDDPLIVNARKDIERYFSILMKMTEHEEILWRKAQRAATLLQLAPFVRFVAVTGSLGRGETKPDSDADLFIVTAPGHLYTARAFALVILQVTGQRINVEGGRIGGTIDPNYWLTTDNLNIKPHTAYVARDYTFLTPLWDASPIYSRLIETNTWVAGYQRQFREIKPKRPYFFLRLTQILLEGACLVIGNRLEKWARVIQKRRLTAYAKRQGISDSVISDDEIRLFLPPKSV
jgi:predicted nucleotidyltransferase